MTFWKTGNRYRIENWQSFQSLSIYKLNKAGYLQEKQVSFLMELQTFGKDFEKLKEKIVRCVLSYANKVK
jgi:hypothetical protein